jgi:hypothetical protein
MRMLLIAVSALFLVLSNSDPLRADNAAPSKLDTMLNDEVIKTLLDEADPEAAFLVRLKMMRAHLAASEFTTGRGDDEEGLNHITHPRTEIYPEIEASMKAHGMADFGSMLDRLEAAFASNDTGARKAALQDVYAELDKAEAAIDPQAMADSAMLAESTALLLRAAVVEYHGAFEFSKLNNTVEYHDGAYFVVEARKLIDQLLPKLDKSDPGAVAKLKESFTNLEKAWPEETPPAELVMPVTKMQALVSIIELQLNKLQ